MGGGFSNSENWAAAPTPGTGEGGEVTGMPTFSGGSFNSSASTSAPVKLSVRPPPPPPPTLHHMNTANPFGGIPPIPVAMVTKKTTGAVDRKIKSVPPSMRKLLTDSQKQRAMNISPGLSDLDDASLGDWADESDLPVT